MNTPTDAPSARIAHLADADPADVDAVHEAVALAAALTERAAALATPAEIQAQQRLARMLSDASGRLLITALTDQALRAHRPERVAEQLAHLINVHGIPRFMSAWERFQLGAFRAIGGVLAPVLVPAVLARVRAEMRQYVLPAAPKALEAAVAARRADGCRLNLNLLGEAILGADEAETRLAATLMMMEGAHVSAVSIKISAIASDWHLSPLALGATLDTLAVRLRRLYRAAAAHGTLVTLDMEEYRDLQITVALFQRVLDEPEFQQLTAGIVLQAYLPDTFDVLQALTTWAQARVAAGGAPVRVRLVKGANLAMEQVEAALHGWPQAPYTRKADVDANFKRLLQWAVRPEHASAVHIGVGSHNTFDVAYALVLRALHGLDAALEIEMLEGIAGPLRRAVSEVAGDILLYAPVVDDAGMQAAIAYLIRRLDENTAPDNFLRHSFSMTPTSEAWFAQQARFEAACVAAERPSTPVRRRQDRRTPPERTAIDAPFVNEADTDWALPHHRAWVLAELEAFRAPRGEPIPLVAGGVEIHHTRAGTAPAVDPSRPGVQLYRSVMADEAALERALATACARGARWGQLSQSARSLVLAEAAQQLRAARGRLIAAMVADGGKSIREADVEVSEAIDFAEFYRRSAERWAQLGGARAAARGVVVVAPPWNFPLAIPAGGALAALAAGNTVILKPAPETVMVAWELCQVLWRAGVPRETLSFLPCANEPVGTALITDPRVDTVVLTGGTATARAFSRWRPEMRLLAETGGKNAMIVTELADLDLAIKDTLQSAFGHAGQKCSATSLLICEKAVYDDPGFLVRLADATQSIPVGSAWDPESMMTPLIRPPQGPLAWGLTELDPGERWLVEPRVDPGNPQLWSPGVKLGVVAGSRTHQTELFGPVLGVMRADDLDDAIRLANATPYGLTAGLQSLDEREQRRWLKSIQAGNRYINRATTGAIVQRQPFGGRKASVWGPGAKAGGEGYVRQLLRFEDVPGAKLDDDDAVARALLAEDRDVQRLLGQDNRVGYRACHGVLLRLGDGTTETDADRVIRAARACAARLWVSALSPAAYHDRLGVTVALERSDDVVRQVASGRYERLRALGGVEADVRVACNDHGVYCDASKVIAEPRVELPKLMYELTTSVDYHRFGNLGAREGEARTPTL